MFPIIAGAALGGYAVLRSVEYGVTVFRARRAAKTSAEIAPVRRKKNRRVDVAAPETDASPATDTEGASAPLPKTPPSKKPPSKKPPKIERRRVAPPKTLAEQLQGVSL